MRLVFSYIITHIAHYPLLHSSLITSLSLAVAPACRHMTHTYSPHKCIVIGCFIAHLILHFRASGWLPCSRGNEEDGVRVGARREQKILASDCVWFPLVLISWCYFDITPFSCHYCVCENRMSGDGWISHSLTQQSVSCTLTLFRLLLPRGGKNSFG